MSTHMVIQDHMFIWAMYALFMLPCSATTFTRHKLINLTTNFTQDYFVGRKLKLKLELNFQYKVWILSHNFSKKIGSGKFFEDNLLKWIFLNLIHPRSKLYTRALTLPFSYVFLDSFSFKTLLFSRKRFSNKNLQKMT